MNGSPPKPTRPRASHWLSPTLLAVALAAATGCGDTKAHALWNDVFHCHDGGTVSPPPPVVIAPVEEVPRDLVQANGDAQADTSGLIKNSAVVGEPIQAGVRSTSGSLEVRHGFALFVPLDAPTGIALATPASAPIHTLN